ncbi:MAG: PEP/pyruvate-binding domain-containing protein [Planctomycetaceae bacterium]
MSPPLVFDGSDLSIEVSADLLGGKAVNLLRLHALGQPVPGFYVISAAALHGIVGSNIKCPDDAAAEQLAAKMRRRIDSAAITAELEQAVRAAHVRTLPADCTVAVRSSAAVEDGEQHSFAGMHESVLNVRDIEAVLAAIKRVWASAFSPRAVAYRRQQGLPPIDTGMAVIVQQMIDARQSGVAFTCHPATGSLHEIVINSVFGVGEGLVSQGFSADSFTVVKETSQVTRELSEKREQLVLDTERGELHHAEVAEHLQRQSSLSDEQVRQVTRAALAIEDGFGRPQDIEFCFDADGELFVLQTRPVTGISNRVESDSDGPAAGNHVIWDNSNIIESYSGVTTPMTFSFIRRAYSIVYHCFAEVMGISPREVHRHREAFDNMLGLFRGRVYYNLKNWYRLVRLFPGYNYNSRFMESMMGLKEPLFLEEQTPQPGALRRWLVEFPLLLRLLLRSGWNFLRIRSKVDRFQRHFHQHYNEWSQIDFDSMRPHELMALHAKMEETLLWNWKVPIINDFYVMVFYGVLKKMCTNWCNDQTGSLQNGLICGEGGLQSDEPAKLLIRMTGLARSIAPLQELILNEPVESLPAVVAADARFGQFNELMTRYLDDYGLRCVGELKLEAYSCQDQPHRLYEMIRNYLSCDEATVCDLEEIAARERGIRSESEQRCREAFSQSRRWLPRRTLFSWVLRNARLGVRNRENMRFARTRIYGILRSMLRSIGRYLTEEGVLDQQDDIFYLTLDEVWDFVRGTAVTADLRGLTSLRRAEYDGYLDETVPPPDSRFETFGMAYHRNRFHSEQLPVEINSNGSLSGIGCCPGVVTGRVQILSDPSNAAAFHGDILVAERTDPGWVPFFPAFSGIVIERGSVLSHSAIVAREMGIPTIVGVTGITETLRTGQRIRMDGRMGTIEIRTEE